MERESQPPGLDLTAEDAERAMARNKAAMAKLDAQLVKRSKQREDFEQKAVTVKQAVDGAGLAPATSAELERQLELLRRRIDSMWEQSRPKVTRKIAVPSSGGNIVDSLRKNMRELDDNLEKAKQGLARYRKTLAEKGLNFPDKGVVALIRGGHIPDEKLRRAESKLAELDAVARRKSEQTNRSKGGKRRRIRLTV